MHGAPSWREPGGRPLPVAATSLHAGSHFRKLRSTVKADAAQDVWRSLIRIAGDRRGGRFMIYWSQERILSAVDAEPNVEATDTETLPCQS